MRLLTKIERIQRERPAVGWLLTTLGILLPLIASFGIWFLFALADFSSNLRDGFEKPPGTLEYALFTLMLIGCGGLFVTGLILIWARARGFFAA